MTKNKIIYENYNPETKESTITIKNKYGTFTGVAKLHPEDEKYFSSFVGFRFAECKAKMKYYQYRAEKAVEKRNNYAELYTTLVRSKFDENLAIMRKIRKYIHVCEREVKYWCERGRIDWTTLNQKEDHRKNLIDKNNGNVKNEAREQFLKLLKEKMDKKD